MEILVQEDSLLVKTEEFSYKYSLTEFPWLFNHYESLYKVFRELTANRKQVPPYCTPAQDHEDLVRLCIGFHGVSTETKGRTLGLINRMIQSEILMKGYGLFWLNPKYRI